MKSTIVSLAVAAAALAVPASSKPVQPVAGATIPLARRSERLLTREDGQIDWDLTTRHLASLYTKYQNGLANYQLARGEPLLGARKLSKRELDAHLAKRSTSYEEEPEEEIDAALVPDEDVEEDGADDLTEEEMLAEDDNGDDDEEEDDDAEEDDVADDEEDDTEENDEAEEDDDADAEEDDSDDTDEELPTIEAAFADNSDELSGDPQALPDIRLGSWKRRSVALQPGDLEILAAKKKASSAKKTSTKKTSSTKKASATKKTSSKKASGSAAAASGKSRAASNTASATSATSTSSTNGPLALTNYMQGLLWYGTISVGTPAKQFKLDFDTGSADMWIPAAACTSCGSHNRYYPSDSSTSATDSGATFSITYGDGSTTGGKVYSDTVSIAGMSATAQPFGAAASLASGFKSDPMDGILGMGYQSLSSMGASPVFATLMAQNKVASKVFSFKLAASNSHLYLGGADSGSYSGAFEWHPLVSQSYWVITGSAKANGATAVSNFNAIIDTGTTVIVAPTSAAQAFWATVPNAQVYGSGYYSYPCASAPTVAFNFGGKDWTMSAATLNLGGLGNTNRCLGAIIGQDIGLDAWIVGGSFLQNVYASFDMGNNQVGFASLA